MHPYIPNAIEYLSARPNLKVLLSFHTFSELILYPWGHTYDPIADGRARQVYETMARTMAGWNGYTPEQSSDLYITDGTINDWLWGVHRIFTYTFEMFPRSSSPGFYPDDALITQETTRNREAVLILLEFSDCPYRIINVACSA